MTCLVQVVFFVAVFTFPFIPLAFTLIHLEEVFLRLLFLGDVVGKPGRRALAALPASVRGGGMARLGDAV